MEDKEKTKVQLMDELEELRKRNAQLESRVQGRDPQEWEVMIRDHLLESSIDSIFLHDLDGNILYANETAIRSNGYSKNELMNLKFQQLVTPEYTKDIKRHVKELMGKGYATFESARRRKDGSIMPVEVYGRVIELDGQKLILHIDRDITERKQAEELLRKERDKAQKYLDVAGAIMLVIDKENKVSLINKTGRKILGYDEEDILGKDWFDNFIPERHRDEVKAVFKKVISGKSKRVQYYENPVINKEGEERIIGWYNNYLKDEHGNVIGSLSSGADITERYKAERARQESEERYRILVENADQAISVVQDGIPKFANSKSEKVRGYTFEEIKELTLEKLVHPDDRETVMDYMARRMKGQKAPMAYTF